MSTGVWLIGARGSVATTAVVGAASVGAGLASPTGCVTELPDLASARLPGIAEFRERRGLDRVVVVNVASTEPPVPPHSAWESLASLSEALTSGESVLPASSLYAYAALTAGCPYVDFTPSTGAWLPAIDELARTRHLPYAGRDGKTGETLLKSVLAPMFAKRALRVRAWSGTNLLGGGDGATLADPAAASAKNTSKQRVLRETLGHPVDGEVHIDHVAGLGDWKTAWDNVLSEGFLGVRMTGPSGSRRSPGPRSRTAGTARYGPGHTPRKPPDGAGSRLPACAGSPRRAWSAAISGRTAALRPPRSPTRARTASAGPWARGSSDSFPCRPR
jgi:hypothetical protein